MFTAPARFKAVTWNPHHKTTLPNLERIATDLLNRNVRIGLMQEATRPGLPKMLRGLGLGAFKVGPEYLVWWDKEAFTRIAAEAVDLSPTEYSINGGGKRRQRAAAVLLADNAGRTVEALSYHFPSMVQRGGPNAEVPNRVKALREATEALAVRARKSEAHACLYGGDDNVDVRNGNGWDFMRKPATGLELVQAPRPTHGHAKTGRKIDNFRVSGLAVGNGNVLPGGGDHRIHLRNFRWE